VVGSNWGGVVGGVELLGEGGGRDLRGREVSKGDVSTISRLTNLLAANDNGNLEWKLAL
jgi:hypothetical protein